MSEIIALPSLGESVGEATITRWLKRPGDLVAVGDPLVEVATDKVDTEIPSPTAGVIETILVAEGETVDFGTALARIESETDHAYQESNNPLSGEQIDTIPEPGTGCVSRPEAGPAYITPLVRRLAHRLDVDLSTVIGTGLGGRISREDVQSAGKAALSEPSVALSTSAPASIQPLDSARINASVLGSAPLVAAVAVSVDVTHLLATSKNADSSQHARTAAVPTLTSTLVFAAASGLRAISLASEAADGLSTVQGQDRIGIALETNRGLVTPAITVPIDTIPAELAHQLRELTERAHTGQLTLQEPPHTGSVLISTITGGALFEVPPVIAPYVATLALGAAHKRVTVVSIAGDDAIAIRSCANLVLSYDHLLVKSTRAMLFLNAIKQQIETAGTD